jgi:hypothetical protein
MLSPSNERDEGASESRRGLRKVAWGATQGFATLGWIGFFSLFCFGCTGSLPVLAGLFGGVAVGTRFGVSVGIATAVVVTVMAVRARRRRACAVPSPRAVPAPRQSA